MKKEKIMQILFFLLIFVTILSSILLRQVDNLDELWNYNFARNIANGLIPYRDFNMVITPLLSIVCGIILKVTCNQLIVMRILASILCSVIFFIMYKLFNILDIKKEISIIFTFIIGCLFKDILCIDYNWATILLVLLIIYNEINIYKADDLLLKNNIKSDLFLGILAGLSVTLKQTSGILICIVLLGNKLMFVKNKKEFIIYLKSFICRLIGILIPIIIMIIYLIFNNAFRNFISYTIEGVSEFSNYISYITLIKKNVIGILAILVPVSFIYFWYKTIIKEKDKKTYLLLVYALAVFVIVFPISDKIHFLIGSTVTIILILYELYNIIQILYNKFLRSKKTILKKILIGVTYIINAFIIFTLIIYSGVNFYKYLNSKEKYSELNYYRYIIIDKNLENQIEKIDNYILSSSKKIKILDASAAVYMIPIDKYNKDYDMLNKGNLGFQGEERIIQEISNCQYIKYLILQDGFTQNWQTPLSIIDYVKENKTKTGEIEIFDIYE